MTTLRNTSLNVLIVILALLLTVAVCEVFTRAIFGDSMVLTPRYHTAGKYEDTILRVTRPNMNFKHTTPDGSWEFTTNAQGFRNYLDFDYEKPDGVLRVISIGDSHTQGHECDQDSTYSAVSERYLQSRGVKAQVLNTGVSGFSTAEALLLLRNELVKYEPDYVVLGFFANDFEDNLKAGLFSLNRSGLLQQMRSEHIPGVRIQDVIYAIPGVQWLGENSYFYSLLFNAAWEFYKSKLAASARRSIPTEYAISTKDEYSIYELDLAAELIKEIQVVSHKVGARFILLDIPKAAGPHESTPSVTPELFKKIEPHPDITITSEILNELQGAAQFHMPRGSRHINSFTHTILGVQIGRSIMEDASVQRPTGPESAPTNLDPLEEVSTARRN